MAVTAESLTSIHRSETKEHRETYRKLNDFENYTPLESCTETMLGVLLNKVGIAKEKIKSQPTDLNYEDTYHIALRHGEFHAQVDKALSEIHRFFIGYGPTVYIIQDGKDFYVASRTIRNLQHYSNLKQDSTGVLSYIDDDVTKLYNAKNLAGFVALAYFFGQSDIHSRNWGIQQQPNGLFAYKIDDADALDKDILSEIITKEAISSLTDHNNENDYSFSLPQALLTSPVFQKELSEMFKKIASTDFSQIKAILKENITTHSATTLLWMQEKFLPILSNKTTILEKVKEISAEGFNTLQNTLQEMEDNFNDKALFQQAASYDVDFIINLLVERQMALKTIFLTQAYTLAASEAVLSETKPALTSALDLYKMSSSSKSITAIDDLITEVTSLSF